MVILKLKMDSSAKGLNLARKAATQSSFTRARMGAVITKGSRVLSSATNQTRYSRDANANWESTHAEEAAIIRILRQPNGLKQLAGATIYVTRIKKDGSCGLAKPCNNCQRLIDSVGIKKVIYTI